MGFLGVNFVSRDVLGFPGNPRDFFEFSFLPPFDHLCHLKSEHTRDLHPLTCTPFSHNKISFTSQSTNDFFNVQSGDLFLYIRFSLQTKWKPREKIQNSVSLLKLSPHANFWLSNHSRKTRNALLPGARQLLFPSFQCCFDRLRISVTSLSSKDFAVYT